MIKIIDMIRIVIILKNLRSPIAFNLVNFIIELNLIYNRKIKYDAVTKLKRSVLESFANTDEYYSFLHGSIIAWHFIPRYFSNHIIISPFGY